jgi:hypothetical protein
MPTVDAAKIKIRRGTDQERKRVILDEGELGYTIDTKRVFAGDGTSTGGNIVGNKTFSTARVATNSVIGDTTLDNNLYYTLTASDYTSTDSWYLLSSRVDGTTIRYNSNNHLELVPGAATLSADKVGAGLALDASDTLYINIATDSESSTLLTFNGSNELSVGTLTNISHGGLGFQDTATLTQHHSNADATNPGFMSPSSFSKLDASPTFPIATAADANLITSGINGYATTLIDASKITGNFVSVGSSNSNSVSRIIGQSATNERLSGGELTDPYYFFNKQDFPGTVLTTGIPLSCISNQGAYANFKIGDFATTDPVTSGEYQDKAFVLPCGDGKIYSIFIENTTDTAAFLAYSEAYPELVTESCEFTTTSTDLQSNVVTAINGLENSFGEKVFDAWLDGDDIYIQCLVKGFTEPYDADYAQGPGTLTYAIGDASVTYANANTYESKNGSGVSAADSSHGKVSSTLYDWLVLSTEAAYLSGRGVQASHSIDNFPAKASLSNGNYFLIYDSLGNRTCVYYDVDGAATQPDISVNSQHRGFITNLVKVDIQSDTTSDEVATSTLNALLLNSYFISVYDVEYSSPTMVFTSLAPGYNDGIVNRKGVGIGSGATFTPNGGEGTPDVRALNGAFYNAYNSNTQNYPQNLITIPGSANTNHVLKDINGDDVLGTTLLKFR